MGSSFGFFDVSIVISYGQFDCGNRGHTQNTDFRWVESHFPVKKGLVEPQLMCATVVILKKKKTYSRRKENQFLAV